MTPDPRLNFLAALREAVGLKQAEVAQRFGLAGRQSYKSVAAWEKGESIPKAKLRARFIRYLWDDLRLHKEPTRFTDCWALLVECWHWEPLSEAEHATLPLPLSDREQRSEANAPPAQTITIDGTVIGGNVTTTGGDVVGRDKIIHQHGYRADEIVKIIETVQRSTSPTMQSVVDEEFPRALFAPETVPIPAGPFWMGSDEGADHERPRHAVTLPAYAISNQPVTNAQYAAFVQQHDEHRPRGGWRFTTPPADKLNDPVTGVSWHDAVAYCAWLTTQSGRHYRLASEAEWEKAAQAGIIVSAIREWTSTIWGDDASAVTFSYPYRADGRDSLTVSGVYRIWRRRASHSVIPGRGFAGPTTRLNDLGLRVVLVVESR